MNGRKRPSPALVIAVLALFVSLSGTAVAAGVVPLAKRALSADKAKQADNAKKLEGQTAAAILAKAAQTPGRRARAAGLVTVKQAADSVAADNSARVRDRVRRRQEGRSRAASPATAASSSSTRRPMSDVAWGIYLGERRRRQRGRDSLCRLHR